MLKRGLWGEKRWLGLVVRADFVGMSSSKIENLFVLDFYRHLIGQTPQYVLHLVVVRIGIRPAIKVPNLQLSTEHSSFRSTFEEDIERIRS
jgi:hypothetical protein